MRIGNQIIIICVAGLATVFCSSGCKKSETVSSEAPKYAIDKKYDRGPMTVHVMIAKDRIDITESMRVRLEAIADEGISVTLPALNNALGENEFNIASSRRHDDKLVDNKKVLHRQDYELDPLVPGEFTIKEMTFQFESPEGQEEDPVSSAERVHELVTEPIEIEVLSSLQPGTADMTLSPIKPVSGIAKVKNNVLWWFFGVLLGICGILLLVMFFAKKKQKAAIRYYKSAHELAYERLWALEDAKLIESGQIKEYYERVSYLLRWYIEHRFNLKAPEQTTEEFLVAAGGSNELDPEQTGYLQSFLQQCDYVKFAGYAPDAGEAEKILSSAKEFIDGSSAVERRVDVTEMRKMSSDTLQPVGGG